MINVPWVSCFFFIYLFFWILSLVLINSSKTLYVNPVCLKCIPGIHKKLKYYIVHTFSCLIFLYLTIHLRPLSTQPWVGFCHIIELYMFSTSIMILTQVNFQDFKSFVMTSVQDLGGLPLQALSVFLNLWILSIH